MKRISAVTGDKYQLDPEVAAKVSHQQAELAQRSGSRLTPRQRREQEETDAYVSVLRDSLRHQRLGDASGRAYMLRLSGAGVALTEWGFVTPGYGQKGYRSFRDSEYGYIQPSLHRSLAAIGESGGAMATAAEPLPLHAKTTKRASKAPSFVGENTHYSDKALTRAQAERASIIKARSEAPQRAAPVKPTKKATLAEGRIFLCMLRDVYEKHPLVKALMTSLNTARGLTGGEDGFSGFVLITAAGQNYGLVLTRHGFRYGSWSVFGTDHRLRADVGSDQKPYIALEQYNLQTAAAACARLDSSLAAAVGRLSDLVAHRGYHSPQANDVCRPVSVDSFGETRRWIRWPASKSSRACTPQFGAELTAAAQRETHNLAAISRERIAAPKRFRKVRDECEASPACRSVMAILQQMHANSGTRYWLSFNAVAKNLVLADNGFRWLVGIYNRGELGPEALAALNISEEALRLAFRRGLNEVAGQAEKLAFPSPREWG